MVRRVAVSCALALALATSAGAQSGASGSTGQTPPASDDTRPATTTFYGDTGLWFVPTAEILPAGKWSASGYRRGTNYIEGYTNVADFAGTFAYGIKDRAEIFGSLLVDTRVARNLRPAFIQDPTFGSVVAGYPKANSSWSGDHISDFYIGAKINFWSEYQQKPAALAIRGILKLPTASVDDGVGTSKVDFLADLIISKELAKKADLSGYAGFGYFGQPTGFDTPTSAFRWGVGTAWPSRSPLRADLELNGMVTSSGAYAITTPVIGVDGSVSPLTSQAESLTRATAALTWQMKNGFFVGGGISWNVPMQARTIPAAIGGEMSQLRDYVDWQVRLGFHPGVRTYVPPPPPPPAAAPAPVAQNRPPTVKAQCDPCTVEVGKSSTVTAVGQDPDGDMLTYRWTAPTGTLANPAETKTLWTAPNQEGTVPVTVTVNDGKGGTASDTVNIQVVRPPAKTYTFEDVHFDFDRYSLRPEATRILDEAITAMRQDAALKLTIEGHTCNIGTAEYNLALGERRANAVRDYLTSNGVSADRLQTISYGEERPKYDNAREETRRLNRRAALVVNLTR